MTANRNSAALRFVLLEHDLRAAPPSDIPPLHWDFMVEQHGREGLRTWRLAENPLNVPVEQHIGATALGDHRRAYLDYEGPVSGGRGVVRRIDTGTCEIAQLTESQIILHVSGAFLRGIVEISLAVDGKSSFWHGPNA